MYKSSLVYHFYQFSLHIIVYVAVSPERPASFHVSRQGSNQIRIGNLFVQVAYKSLACRMAAGYIIQWSLHGIIAMRVKNGNHAVYAAMFQKFTYAQIIGVYGLERK